MKLSLLLPTIFLLLQGVSFVACAEEKTDRFQPVSDEPMHRQLLSPEERQQYRETLWELKTEAERERFRDEQREILKERARADGLPLNLSSPEIESESQGKEWPQDGLRRWPTDRAGKDGLRRWDGKPERKEKAGGDQLGDRINRDPGTRGRARTTVE